MAPTGALQYESKRGISRTRTATAGSLHSISPVEKDPVMKTLAVRGRRGREHFLEAEIVELTFIIGYQAFASKFTKASRHRAFLPELRISPRPGRLGSA
jgi:hypothetical protein